MASQFNEGFSKLSASLVSSSLTLYLERGIFAKHVMMNAANRRIASLIQRFPKPSPLAGALSFSSELVVYSPRPQLI